MEIVTSVSFKDGAIEIEYRDKNDDHMKMTSREAGRPELWEKYKEITKKVKKELDISSDKYLIITKISIKHNIEALVEYINVKGMIGNRDGYGEMRISAKLDIDKWGIKEWSKILDETERSECKGRREQEINKLIMGLKAEAILFINGKR